MEEGSVEPAIVGAADRTRAAWLRVGFAVSIAVGAASCIIQSLACSSSSSGSLVGEWQLGNDGGDEMQLVYFNSNGTCGFFDQFNGQSECQSNCTYQLNGDSLTVVLDQDGGMGESVTVDVSVSGNTLTITPSDGGGGVTDTYTRVNSNSSNSCP